MEEFEGEIIYCWTPDHSKIERPKIADVAEEYVVTRCDDALCGVIIYGKYHGKWQANPAALMLSTWLRPIR